MQRRQYLSVATTGTLAAIAGCGGDEIESDENTGAENGDDADGGRTESGGGGTDGGTEDEDGEDEQNGNDGGDETDEPVPTEFASIRTVDGYYDPGVHRFQAARNFRSDHVPLDDGLTVVTFEHIVGFEFGVELLDANGAVAASVVDHHGPIEGATAVPLAAGDYSLDVTNVGGYWDVSIAQPSTPAAAIHQPPVEATGTGFDVVGTVDLDGSTTISATHDGESDFRLLCYDETATGADDAAVVFDEEGEFEGETTTQFDATSWIGVEADGTWTFEIR